MVRLSVIGVASMLLLFGAVGCGGDDCDGNAACVQPTETREKQAVAPGPVFGNDA